MGFEILPQKFDIPLREGAGSIDQCHVWLGSRTSTTFPYLLRFIALLFSDKESVANFQLGMFDCLLRSLMIYCRSGTAGLNPFSATQECEVSQ